ncbi:KY49.ctg7180000000014_quiver, whole genome shotgun sequence [Burkholderia multivorans]
MKHALKYRRSLTLVATSLLLGISVAPVAYAQSTNSAVYPPGNTALGLSYGEWSAAWWQWLLAIPTGPGNDQNPQDQPTGAIDCGLNQSGPVWFLAGSGSGATVTRTCSSNISSTTSLLLPLINVECSTQDQPPFHCTDAASCRRCAASFANFIGPNTLHMSVDGIEVLNGVQGFRSQSPFFSFTTPANNILGSTGGPGMSVSDGYWAMLRPLSPGQHTIKFGGTLVRGPFSGFTQNVTYIITVSQ